MGRIVPLRGPPTAECRAITQDPCTHPQSHTIYSGIFLSLLWCCCFATGYVLSIHCNQQTAEHGYDYTVILTNILTNLEMASRSIPKPKNLQSSALPQSLLKSLVKFTISSSVSNRKLSATLSSLSPSPIFS